MSITDWPEGGTPALESSYFRAPAGAVPKWIQNNGSEK